MNYKQVSINLSFTSLVKSKCKFCGGSPYIYFCYYDLQPTKYFYFRNYPRKKKIKRTSLLWWGNPSNLTSISFLNFSLGDNQHFDSRLENRRFNSFSKIHYIESLSCSCLRTQWFFKFKNVDSLEIIFRKSRNCHSQKFDD
jgi:hypothetical protein